MTSRRDWLAFEPDAGSLEEDVRRREFVRYVALLGGMAALDPERLSTTLRGLVHVDRTLLGQLRGWTYGLARQWSMLPPPVLRADVGAHLTALCELLAGPLPPGLRRDLMAVAAQTAALAGLVARMVGDDEEARQQAVLAGQLASSIGEAGLEALALVWISDTVSAVQRGETPNPEHRHALAFLDRAENLAGPSAPAAVRALVMLRQAEEQAAAGDGAEARRYLDRADTAVTLSIYSDEHDLYGLGWQRECLHRSFRGNVELLAGDASAAVVVLQDALERTPQESTSNQAALLSDLAAAHACLGDLDASVSLLSSAWAIADRAGLEDRRRRIRGIRRRDLERWAAEPAMRRLDEAIRAAC